MKRNRILTLLIVLTLVFIWGNSLLSRSVSGYISDGLMTGLNRVSARLGAPDDLFTSMRDEDGDGTVEPTSHGLRKAAHVAEYAALAVLLLLRLDGAVKRPYPLALSLGGAVGAIDETLQIFSHRGSQVRDVFIDLGGAVLGLLLVFLFYRVKNARRQRKNS